MISADGAARVLLRRGDAPEYTTLAWNVIGIVVLAIAAVSARSVAPADFGLDSVIGSVRPPVVNWALSGTAQDASAAAMPALGMVGWVAPGDR